MRESAGFSLLETLVAVSVLLLGVGVAIQLFYRAVETGRMTRERTAALFVAAEKLEDLRAEGAQDLVPGGGLDPESPVTGYWERLEPEATTVPGMPVLRLWQIDSAVPRTVTVAVFGDSPTRRRGLELARLATRVGPRF